MEELTYSLETNQERALFEQDFPHLATRLSRLHENLACWYELGDIHGFVPSTYDAGNIPSFAEISFPREAGERFEARMLEYYKSAKVWRDALPAPDFDIVLTVDFGAARESINFSFAKCNDEKIRAFCKEIARRAEIHYRRRFLRRS